MKKLSSTLLLLLSAIFILASAGTARANRGAAAEIAYKWISDSTYLLTYTFYRDCGGATAEPSSVNLCYYNTCNTDRGNVTLAKKTPLSSNGAVVQSSCAGASSTTCSSPAGTLKGFRKWVYEGVVSLPSKCASWHFVVSISSRNAGISNYTVPAASDRLYSETTLNNIDAPTGSSPVFNMDLIQYMCAGTKQTFTMGGTDPDGDVLTYTLIDPASAADNQTTCTFPPAPTSYAFGGPSGGTSLINNPFLTGTSFLMNSGTGLMSFTPQAATAQQPVMTLLVTQRKGATVVGTMTRDIQFIISTGCTPANETFAINNGASSGALIAGKTATVCPNVAHRICFGISSPDATVTISNVTDNHLTFSPTAGTSTITPAGYAGVGTNNVTACFDWTPNEKDEGLRNLIINSEICKPGTPKIYRRDTIIIDVVRTVNIVATDTFICFGDTTTLCATPAQNAAGTAVFGYSNTDHGTGIPNGLGTLGISTATDSCTKVIPSATGYFLFETDAIPAFCKRVEPGLTALNTNQAEIKIVVVNPKIDAGPDTVMCSYSPFQMNSNLLNPQPELTYSYRWSPGKWLNDSTSPTPVLSFPPGTPTSAIPDSIVFTLTCTPYPSPECQKTDKVTVHILKGFYILTGDTLAGFTGLGFMGRQKGISDTAICLGKSIAVIGWGDPRYNYIWNPATGVSTPSAFTSGMTITPTATTDYSLTASRAGCPDSTKILRIVVDPVPTASIGDDQTICFGDTLNLVAQIVPSPEDFPLDYDGRQYTYSWSPGGALSRSDTFFTYFTGYRTEKITFTVKTPAGCTGTDDAVYTVQPRSFITVGADTAICPGDTAQLSVVGDPLLKTVTWKPLTDIDSLHGLNPKVNPYFTTDYVVVAVDSNQCVDSGTIRVTVYPRAVLYLQDSAIIYPGEVFKINPQGNVLFYSWFPLTGFVDINDSLSSTPRVSPLLNTMYTVKGVSDAGCTVQDSIFVLVAPDSYIDVPNAFTPGRGGENNEFKPVHLGNATLKSFTIYNRWGVKMFESTDMNKGWDGSFGGQPQPLGVYVYVLEATSAAGKTITKQGNVTLIR